MVPVDWIVRNPAFRVLSYQAIDAFARAASEVRFRADERMVVRGETARRAFIIVEGMAKLVAESPRTRTPRILHIYRPGHVVGTPIVFENMADLFDVVAMLPVRAAEITRRDLFDLARQYPEMYWAVARVAAWMVIEMGTHALRLTSDDTLVRLAQLLLDFAPADVEHSFDMAPLSAPLSQRDMAQYIGTSRPHVSKLLAELEKAGAVQRAGRRNVLVNRQALERVIVGEEAREAARRRERSPDVAPSRLPEHAGIES